MAQFYAHSKNNQNKRHDLPEHLRGVADKAANFAKALNGAELARLAGFWHDLGKFKPAWQNYLLECEKGNILFQKIDHKAAGSLLAQQQDLGY